MKLMIKYTLTHVIVYAFIRDAYELKQKDKALSKTDIMEIAEELIIKELFPV
jgi:oligoendopeptidase F